MSPVNPLIGANTTLTITSQNVSSVALSCVDTDSGTVFGNQSVAVGSASIAVPIQADATCTVVSTAADGSTISADVGVDVNCGNKIKVGGHCEDFSCKTLVALQPLPNGTLQVPARTVDGLCYAVHMADAIANSPSNLTTTIDTQVISLQPRCAELHGQRHAQSLFDGTSRTELCDRRSSHDQSGRFRRFAQSHLGR